MSKADNDSVVLVKECGEYEPDKIRLMVLDGMKKLGYSPRGKVALKPNVVCAFDPKFSSVHAYTHPKFLSGVVRAVSEQDEVSGIAITETSAVGNPSPVSFHFAGYTKLVRELKKEVKKPVRLVGMDEEMRKEVFLGGVVHHQVRLARSFALADSKIYLPKLKGHCVSRMTGAVKLNIGILSFDDRSVRHDFLLDQKIVDLLRVGYPDFVVMDAITIGVGNEALPIPRKLGLILMGRNPVAVDLVASRLLGMRGEVDVPYLALAIKNGYKPASLEEVKLIGDAESEKDLERFAERVKPYDDEFYRWQDVNKELERMRSPLRLYFGPYSEKSEARCETGCVMGLKMYLAFLEAYAGVDGFARAKPGIFVIGKIREEIDAKGANVFIFGSCSSAKILNPGKVVNINKCFTTASDMFLIVGNRTGIKSPFFDPKFLSQYVPYLLFSIGKKLVNGRYLQDIAYFASQGLFRKI